MSGFGLPAGAENADSSRDVARLGFSLGARGFVVERLQSGLAVKPDGIFGAMTAGAVRRLQKEHGLVAMGRAGAAEFAAAGVQWPSEFAIAMNLVCNFEGTSFGQCNRRDIDGAGLTLGIAGFTTAHGEVQELLAQYLSVRPGALEALSAPLRDSLADYLERRPSAAQWSRLFYGADGRVLQGWVDAFALWGRCEVMQKMQMEMAKKRFWLPAVAAAESLELRSLRARVFMLDVAVQNGGWRRSHLVLARRMVDWYSGDEQKALVVAARAVAACAKERWRNDVLSRKMAIATGRGVVHGREWVLSAYALSS